MELNPLQAFFFQVRILAETQGLFNLVIIFIIGVPPFVVVIHVLVVIRGDVVVVVVRSDVLVIIFRDDVLVVVVHAPLVLIIIIVVPVSPGLLHLPIVGKTST